MTAVRNPKPWRSRRRTAPVSPGGENSGGNGPNPLYSRSAAGCVSAVLITVGWMAAVILLLAGDGALLAREMLRHAPPERTGLPAAEYAGVGRMTADYLTGRRERFQHEFLSDTGMPVRCFNAREQAHMADVRGLIALARGVAFAALCAGLALLGWGLFFAGKASLPGPETINGKPAGREAFRRGIRLGLAGLALLASGLAVWAILNFEGFFVTFHRLAFTNDLWLMDPRTDLIIRLMPTSFFIALGRRGALLALLAPAFLLVISRTGCRHRTEGRFFGNKDGSGQGDGSSCP